MVLNFQQFKSLVKQVKMGKHLPEAIYLHESTLDSLPSALHAIVKNVGKALHIRSSEWNLIKLYKRDFKLSFLHYPDFENYAYPPLNQSITVDLQKLSHRRADYSKSDNPPILHRKETFVNDSHPQTDEFKAITAEAMSLS